MQPRNPGGGEEAGARVPCGRLTRRMILTRDAFDKGVLR